MLEMLVLEVPGERVGLEEIKALTLPITLPLGLGHQDLVRHPLAAEILVAAHRLQIFQLRYPIIRGLEEEGVLGRLTLEALEDKAHIFQAVINAFRRLGDLEEIQEEVLAVVLY